MLGFYFLLVFVIASARSEETPKPCLPAQTCESDSNPTAQTVQYGPKESTPQGLFGFIVAVLIDRSTRDWGISDRYCYSLSELVCLFLAGYFTLCFSCNWTVLLLPPNALCFDHPRITRIFGHECDYEYKCVITARNFLWVVCGQLGYGSFVVCHYLHCRLRNSVPLVTFFLNLFYWRNQSG
jgi:hypothetical protein